ncbi:glycosyltransferase family 1 protein [Lentzea tibetensis]|uniref:Glycosyltransferase family 1 protein n=1 Tax=Lentzea tibetensis TaxID=2591470 RepID=A0A563EKH2_9PSEU|nr:glycosyltransferase [Lentzea tibetensis]TWP47522.1 glycosyltransferase family 1 protein [Lentzea tibetensis]
MRALLSTIGSRGEVQPVAALATRLIADGHEARVCAPPDFGDWLTSLGVRFTPLGPEVRKPHTERPTPEHIRRQIEGTVATQFETITTAATGCDVIVGAGALQIAARSIAERQGVPYVYVSYSSNTLPSPHHSPPGLPWIPKDADPSTQWEKDAEHLNAMFGPVLNEHRAKSGQAPVDDVRGHLFTDQPWLATDPVLDPWPGPADVVQTGAWILPDERPLAPELEEFLDDGPAPVYFGFGSMNNPRELGEEMVRTARELGRRSVVLRGWAELDGPEAPDCILIGEVNQQKLFKRVAAVVHHGGAGTTTAAALAGAPQVVVPHMYDQHHWARQVQRLGIGTQHEDLKTALEQALHTDKSITITTDGTEIAARRLAQVVG